MLIVIHFFFFRFSIFFTLILNRHHLRSLDNKFYLSFFLLDNIYISDHIYSFNSLTCLLEKCQTHWFFFSWRRQSLNESMRGTYSFLISFFQNTSKKNIYYLKNNRKEFFSWENWFFTVKEFVNNLQVGFFEDFS